jgi:exopolysaccharide biosynthesis protein
MLTRILLFVVLSVAQHTFAQSQLKNPDSVTLMVTRWEEQKIAPKTRLFTHHFNEKNLFTANQYVAYIEIRRKGNAPLFAIGNEVKEKKTTSTFGVSNQAIAAINGTFFDVANGGSVDFVKINDTVVKTNRLTKNGERAVHQKAAIVIAGGALALKKWDGSSTWETNLTEPNVMLSGPLLVYEKQIEKLDTGSFTTARHPRSAIGIKPNGNIILLTVDGRQENAAGMSLPELTKLMRWLGCTSAINLDGGGSTTLWVANFGGNGVVNFPSDNKKWDHEGERKVANVILLQPKAK